MLLVMKATCAYVRSFRLVLPYAQPLNERNSFTERTSRIARVRTHLLFVFTLNGLSVYGAL